MNKAKLCSGTWDEISSWEFFLSDELPPLELCTSASCVGIMEPSGHIVLTHTHRGWGCMGGHIESGETVVETMRREALEEGGFRVQRHILLGYRKVTNTQRLVALQTGKAYPFPISYIPWFVASTTLPLVPTSGDEGEVFGSCAFSVEAARKLGLEEQPMIEAALGLYKKRSLLL